MAKNGYSRKGTKASGDHSSFDDDDDAIQDEVDNFYDPVEAADWLENDGYDPNDFDYNSL